LDLLDQKEIEVPGPKGDKAGGVVYVRWGDNSCPDGGAQLVYADRAGGPHYTQGGGSNPQCLPLDPNFYGACGSLYLVLLIVMISFLVLCAQSN